MEDYKPLPDAGFQCLAAEKLDVSQSTNTWQIVTLSFIAVQHLITIAGLLHQLYIVKDKEKCRRDYIKLSDGLKQNYSWEQALKSMEYTEKLF